MQIKFVSVHPTVFFIRSSDALLQKVEITLLSDYEADVRICVSVHGKTHTGDPFRVLSGTGVYDAYVPDVTEPAQAEFIVMVDGSAAADYSIPWSPQKHWEVYFTPVTHHDLGYTDTVELLFPAYNNYYNDVLRFCEETRNYPPEAQYHYTVECSWSLKHFLDNCSHETAEKFMNHVRNGRIEITAFYANVVDALCGHEELIRLMYPSFEIAGRCGANINSACIVDIPGLSWGIPAVLANAGVKYFYAGMPTYFEWGSKKVHTFWDESSILRHGRPDAFYWEAQDGKRVLVYYQGEYGRLDDTVLSSPDSFKEVFDRLPGLLEKMQSQGNPFTVARYADHATDNSPPQMRICDIARQWNRQYAYPRLIVGTNSMFFEKLEEQCTNLRTFRGELPHTDYNVAFTSAAHETAINRTTHDSLHSAEKFSLASMMLTGAAYPAKEIDDTYNDMLMYDEHCFGMFLPLGRAQDWSWNSKANYAYRAASRAHLLGDTALNRIFSAVRRDEEGYYLTVFNPLSHTRTDVVHIQNFDYKDGFELIDMQTEEKIPWQFNVIDNPLLPQPYAAQRYAQGRVDPRFSRELVFVAENVPAMGYKSYRLMPSSDKDIMQECSVEENCIESNCYRILFSDDGAITSIYDKQCGWELVDRNAPHAFNELLVRTPEDGVVHRMQHIRMQRGANGPVFQSMVLFARGEGCPQVAQEITLYNKLKRIDISNRVLKDSTPHQEVYFAFPFDVSRPSFDFEGTNCVIEAFKDQFPGSNTNYYTVQHWARVTGDKTVILSPVDAHVMEFGGLWDCYVSQAHHGITPEGFGRPFAAPGDITCGHMYSFVMNNNYCTNFLPSQQSDTIFRYGITSGPDCPHSFGWEVCNPLTATFAHRHAGGMLEPAGGICVLEDSGAAVLSAKQALDGRGIILRVMEWSGQARNIWLELPVIEIFDAFETDLVERVQNTLVSEAHRVKVPLRPHAVTTVRIEPKPADSTGYNWRPDKQKVLY